MTSLICLEHITSIISFKDSLKLILIRARPIGKFLGPILIRDVLIQIFPSLYRFQDPKLGSGCYRVLIRYLPIFKKKGSLKWKV